MQVEEITLSGKHVRLEPLRAAHTRALWQATGGRAAEIFRWYTHPMVTEESLNRWAEKALQEQAQGVSLPFVTIDARTDAIVGGTRFMNIDRDHRRAEIGNTWIAPQYQRTAINTEAKYLMLQHAFEVWKCIRVELKTDALNERSRAAILRLGAKEEGTIRNHMVCHDGRLRNSVLHSITAEEWPPVKQRLEGFLRGRR